MGRPRLKRLTRRESEVLFLRYGADPEQWLARAHDLRADMSIYQAGRVLGIGHSAVLGHEHRGLDRLRWLLGV